MDSDTIVKQSHRDEPVLKDLALHEMTWMKTSSLRACVRENDASPSGLHRNGLCKQPLLFAQMHNVFEQPFKHLRRESLA
jgi:hypothetical protein